MNSAKRTFNPLLSRSFRYSQTENADLIYYCDWGATIQPDTIASSTWVVEDGSVTITNEAATDYITSAMITGDVGESTIVNKIVMASGQTDERIIKLKIVSNDVPFLDGDYGCWL